MMRVLYHDLMQRTAIIRFSFFWELLVYDNHLRSTRMKPVQMILLLATLMPFLFGCANAASSTSTGSSGTGGTGTTTTGNGTQIIADHTIVSQYDKIPQKYIDLVKCMWVNVPGESHSQAYRDGLTVLASINPKFAVSVIDGTAPEAYTTANLRSSKMVSNGSSGWNSWTGEQGYVHECMGNYEDENPSRLLQHE